MFSKINLARMHNEISGMQIKARRDPDSPADPKWNELYNKIKIMNGLEVVSNE